MTLSFSLYNGLIASWYSVMNVTFRPLPLGNPQDTDKIIGYIGILSIIGNTVGGILVSRVVDRMKGKMKKILLVLMSSGIVCWIWLGLICLQVIPFSLCKYYYYFRHHKTIAKSNLGLFSMFTVIDLFFSFL